MEGSLALNGASSVFVQGNYAYVAANTDDGLQVIELGENALYGLELGALETSSLQVDNHAQFNNYVDVKGGLGVGASANIAGSLSVGKQLIDSSGNAGTAGQVLSSTSTSTQWMDALSSIPSSYWRGSIDRYGRL